jgi:plastocyanin
MRIALIVLALGSLVACGDDDGDDTASGDCRVAEGGEVTLVAKSIKWDTECLEAPAGEPLTIVVDNQDRAVSHNLHVKDAPDEAKTELEAGPVTQRLDVTLDAGAYEYVCDIHPNMVGTLNMVEANPGET